MLFNHILLISLLLVLTKKLIINLLYLLDKIFFLIFIHYIMNKSLCTYSEIFGKPNEGVHSYRLGGLAIVDVTLTILLAVVIWYLFPHSSLILILVLLFALGIISHRLFCVRSTVDKMLFE